MKIVNIILGIGTAVILGALINLGIRAFHPGPVGPDYSRVVTAAVAMPSAEPCATGDKACYAKIDALNQEQQKQQDEFNKEQQQYEDLLKVYDRDVFIIANIAGIVIFVAGFWLLFATEVAAQSVPIGVMIAGLYGIIYGYAVGWGSTNDQLKFFIGLAIAVLVIGGSMWLMKRYQKNSHTTKA
jgi:heme/copper-type cytochrome/quinol oxidase subunit 4